MKSIYRNLARIGTAAAVICSLAMPVSAHSDFLLKLQALKSPMPTILDLGEHKPVITENDSLVPIRLLAEGAGMTASWDQPTQTATMTLYSCAWSDYSIERYASQLMEKVNTYGLDVTPYSITADFKLNDDTAVVRYNYKDSDDDIISIGKTVAVNGAATLVDDGTLMVPLKSSMEIFSLDVELDSDLMEAGISIPDYVKTPENMSFMAQKQTEDVVTAASVMVSPEQGVNMDPKLGKYLGRFQITHYCTCMKCNGGWGTKTAWAGEITPGQTIAVDPDVIPKLASVYIDGYGYRRAEDCGGAIKGNRIDVAVSSHSEVMSSGTVYKDVYLVD